MGTIGKETKALLFSTYNSVDKQFLPQKGEGWVNLANFGSAIKKVGVNYVNLGYSKLSQLIAAIDNVEVFSDESVRPPVKYLRFKSVKKDNDSVTSKHKDTIKTTDTAIVEFGNNSQIRKKDSRYIDLCRPKPMGWGTKQLSCLIGFYDDEHKSFSKIWTRNFRKIDNYPNSDLPVCPLPVSFNGLIHNQVYTFNWDFSNSSTNIYDIVVAKNSQFRHIDARQLIETLYKDSIDNESREKDISVSAVETIKKQVSGQDPCTFLYELLQNANDEPDGDFVEVEIRLTNNMLVFRHTGKQFTAIDVLGICGVGDGSKADNKEAIGYKGIGFKNVFIRNSYVYIKTGDYSFSFDEKNIGDSFMTTPKWEESDQLDSEIKNILAQDKDKFHVNIFMKPRTKKALFEEEHNYQSLLHKAFDDIKQILFISHINKVSVMIEGEGTFVCSRDTNGASWVFSKKYPAFILPNLRNRINERLKEDTNRLPPKMKNKQETFASFACQTKDNSIVVNEKETHIYCGLKAEKTKWGFPFEMNTDMVPTGPRDDIESGEFWNKEWANIAGALFFEWLNDLIDDEEYNLSSIFRLVPNFELCKEQHVSYTKFIDNFQNGFENELKEKVLIPVEGEKKNILSDTILDTTGFTSSEIITDEDFYKVTGYVISLPANELRGNADFEKVQKRYLEQFQKQEQIFTKENLLSLCDNTNFQKWLQKTEHNNAFLSFLIDKEWLSDFKKKTIFLGENKNLYTADQIFFNIDQYKDDIAAFIHHIPYLSLATRNYFSDKEESLKEIESTLKVFKPKTFVDEVLLAENNIEQTKARLNCKTTSLHFYHFLATNIEFSQAYKDLPYINDEDKVVSSFDTDFIFVDNGEGKLQTNAKWLEGIPFSFISTDYGEDVLNYFKNASIEGSDVSTPTFGVLDYDKSIIIENVILNEKYAEKVNTNQQKNDDAHKSFISFCYANRGTLNTGSLKQYAIKVNEKNEDGETRYELTEANIFFGTPPYDVALAHPWIDTDWMFSLSNDLLSAEISTDIEQLKKFYEDKFGVKELTDQLFYDEIVSKNIDAILKSTSKPTTESIDNENLSETAISAIIKAKKCNFDFVDYLNDNIDIVFKDNDFTKFNKLALIDYNGEFITNDSVIFFYNEVLLNFISKEWLPSNIVNMCSKNYGLSIALKKMQVDQNPRIKNYDFATLYNLVIVPNLAAINRYLDNKIVNLDFHDSIIANIGAIKPDDRNKISKAKVFIRGKDKPVEPASGHKIVSKTVEELVELSLVDYGELDLLDQDYHANEHTDYWHEALCNESFSIKNFQNWLINNKEAIATKLQDKTLNIKFWRWAKKNLKENVSCLSGLPILVKGENAPRVLSGEIYFSDEYLDTSIESLVTAVAPNAPIITSDYISLDEKKKDWVDFWTQLGVQENEVEVLENVIRTRLSTTKVANLVDLIYKNRTLLEPRFNNNLIGNLADIQLVGTDRQYRAAKDCTFVLYISEEPFAYISIPNRVGSSQAGVNSFIGEIIQKHNEIHYITDLTKWRQEKIEVYLALQNENKQGKVHMALIKELAILINANKDNLSTLPKISDIHLLDRDNTYKPCKALTEGSKYHPFFDFETCGITLDYISDSYLSCGESVIKLFDYLKVHHNLEENDLSYLSNYTTACYFWKNYLGANDTRSRDKNIKHAMNFITPSKNPFNGLACVPTLDGNVVKAESLYSLHIRDKVALLTDGEKLLPLDIVAEGVLVDENSASKESVCFMDKLSFKNMLSVQHCFDALCNIPADIQTTKEKELRKELVKWIISQKDDIGTKLAEYRANENSLWYNGLSQKQQIAKLYALNPKDNLEQYFSNNAKIIDASYVANKDNQQDAFAALGIKVISQTDVATVPSADKKLAYNSNSIKKDLKFYTLIISGIENSESWKDSYEEYCSKVDKMTFWTCSAIEKKYKQDGSIVKKLSGFYYEDGNDEFYYKGDLNSPLVFLDYVKGVKEYLGLKADIEIIKNVMFDRLAACNLIKEEYGRLLSDEEFVEEVRKTIPKFNHKVIVEPTTKPTMTESITESVNPTKTESVNPPQVVEKQKEQEINNEDSENTVHLSKAETNTLSQSEQIEAQLEAQKYLLSIKPMWEFPDNFAEVDEDGKPYCFSTFNIKDEEENDVAIVLKSYKNDKAPFSINPEEWDYLTVSKAKLVIYRGNGHHEELEKEDLIRNQNCVKLRFSTENLDIEDRISQFSDILHYFKQIHFDFESFNISKRAKSIVGITNKNQGKQTGGSDDDI
uniref:OST-HTH/LOTUS domain-containing protein n=1 Tax=Prevotella sp. TaxID=59823 RepID=UPI0040265B0C